ncbi:MAG: class I SAM-dependent methyltransferase [Magnetococcales bacterium]|nr:class I SAM-dependent methyltransferase [Magnetococcales bacterium]NGZ05537.1 class I SAM-dependent methyltransferase [Magnetococcales bacterium]
MSSLSTEDHSASRSLGHWIDHAQTRIREWIAPLDHVAALVPKCDHVLELGCGQGILIRKLAPRIPRITGVDYDARKCTMAREQLCRGLPGVTIEQADILTFLATIPDHSVDCVILADTLASNPVELQERILTESVRVLARPGTLLLKIMDTTPRAKFLFSRLVSELVYRVLRLSVSSHQRLFHQSSTWYGAQLTRLGLTVRVVSLHRALHNPFSHAVVLGT